MYKYWKHLGLAITVIGISAAAAAEEAIPSISVVGTAVTRVAPDIVTWHITIGEFDQTVAPAKERSDVKLKALLRLAKDLDVEAEDIQTAALSIQREYNRDEHGNRTTFKHFAVSQRLTVQQRNLERFDAFSAALFSVGDIEVRFSLASSEVHKLRAKTRLDAMRIAKEKAEALCEVVGAKLGKPLRIEEYKRDEYGRGTSWYVSNVAIAYNPGDATPDVAQGTFAPGAIEIRVTIYADFEIV